MNFNTSGFAIFIAVVAVLYWATLGERRLRAQNLLLLIASYVFYMSWDRRFLFLLLFSTALDYLCGLGMASQAVPRRAIIGLIGLLTAGVLLCSPYGASGVFEEPSNRVEGSAAPASTESELCDWAVPALAAASSLALGFLFIVGNVLSNHRRRQYFMALSAFGNLSILGAFKYANFFIESAAATLGSLGLHGFHWSLNILLPVGISFYTFQTLSYTIDVYRREMPPVRDLLSFALFVVYFPQLVAGPIERAVVLLPQIERPRSPTWLGVRAGCFLIGWGLFKKIFIADNLARTVALVYESPGPHSGPEVLLATYAFAWQIYCDFSGYTDVARGVSRCMGIELMLNFNLPYFSTNPRDFWRRWHISLSTWLRDYVYITLGGNRGPGWFVYRNLMLTMVIGGLWHGARENFIYWGVYQGMMLCGHRFLEERYSFLRTESLPRYSLARVLSCVVFFHFTCYGWLLFRAESGGQIASLTADLLRGWGDFSQVAGVVVRLVFYTGLLLIVQVEQCRSGNLLAPLTWPWPARVALYVVMFYLVVIFGAFDEIDFIYFQF